ncbi:hypothetical protein Spica_0009 [Gracilinema caldarium DSM 7334]|uniref:Uncharacterized protein n=2 Tax=Gracilinema caldarium TaxID=215591 RepID=F8EWL8_GRAC1|nr:hypothetical protein Spica_0009 [Gracilinema caldarium DSM 7334]
MKKQLCISFFSFYFLFSSYATSLSEIVSRENLSLLLINSKIINVTTGTVQPKLVPEHNFVKVFVTAIQDQLKPAIIVENVYLYRKASSKIGKSWTEIEQLKLFNEIRALSTLKGIEYYSASRKKMRTFYEDSFVIDKPETKNPLPDPTDLVLPKETSLFAWQKDLTFGGNIYRYDYKTSDNSILFIQTNLTTLSYGIFPLVAKENLKSLVCIIDIDEGLLLYAVTFARSSTVPGVEGKIKDSFSNRTEAIYKWFATKADKIFM